MNNFLCVEKNQRFLHNFGALSPNLFLDVFQHVRSQQTKIKTHTIRHRVHTKKQIDTRYKTIWKTNPNIIPSYYPISRAHRKRSFPDSCYFNCIHSAWYRQQLHDLVYRLIIFSTAAHCLRNYFILLQWDLPRVWFHIRRDTSDMNWRPASNPWNQAWSCTREGIEKPYRSISLWFHLPWHSDKRQVSICG
jgi:hypothetical protein